MVGTLVQLNISSGGMPKLPITEAHVGVGGVEGDRRRNRKYHGGAGRAVCLFAAEVYGQLHAEGIELAWGSVGENFTTRGFDLDALQPGARLRVGACAVELTAVREPCRSLDQWDKRLKKLILGRSGWVAKVLETGRVRAGDVIELIP